jgi:hypothetical protein
MVVGLRTGRLWVTLPDRSQERIDMNVLCKGTVGSSKEQREIGGRNGPPLMAPVSPTVPLRFSEVVM